MQAEDKGDVVERTDTPGESGESESPVTEEPLCSTIVHTAPEVEQQRSRIHALLHQVCLSTPSQSTTGTNEKKKVTPSTRRETRLQTALEELSASIEALTNSERCFLERVGSHATSQVVSTLAAFIHELLCQVERCLDGLFEKLGKAKTDGPNNENGGGEVPQDAPLNRKRKKAKDSTIKQLESTARDIRFVAESLDAVLAPAYVEEGWDAVNAVDLSNRMMVVQLAEKVQKQLNSFVGLLAVTNAFVSRYYTKTSPLARGVTALTSAIYYFFRRGKARKRAASLRVALTVEFFSTMWNLLDDVSPIRFGAKLLNPRIKTSVLFHILGPTDEAPSIPVRLITSQRAYVPIVGRGMCCKVPDPPMLDEAALEQTLFPPSSKVILHFHGGGFLAMSSASHECYLRVWAKDTGIPVFSVDYQLVPAVRFPVQHEECYHVYKWLLNHLEQSGAAGVKVILAGDSAGGNLAASVILRAIMDGIRVPDGVLLVYPALNLTFTFLPSRINAFTDPLLSFGALRTIAEMCIPKDCRDPPDFTISPLLAPPDLLRRFPPCCFMVGTEDPLFDDSIRMAKRLVLVGVDVHLQVYEKVTHGFLNLASVASKLKPTIHDAAVWLVKLGEERRLTSGSSCH